MDSFYDQTHSPFHDQLFDALSNALKHGYLDFVIPAKLMAMKGVAIPEPRRSQLIELSLRYLASVLLPKPDSCSVSYITEALAGQVGSIERLREISDQLGLGLHFIEVQGKPIIAREQAVRLLKPVFDCESIQAHAGLAVVLQTSGIEISGFYADEFAVTLSQIKRLPITFFPFDTSTHRINCKCPVCYFKGILKDLSHARTPYTRFFAFCDLLTGLGRGIADDETVCSIVQHRLWDWIQVLSLIRSGDECTAEIRTPLFESVNKFFWQLGIISPQLYEALEMLVGYEALWGNFINNYDWSIATDQEGNDYLYNENYQKRIDQQKSVEFDPVAYPEDISFEEAPAEVQRMFRILELSVSLEEGDGTDLVT